MSLTTPLTNPIYTGVGVTNLVPTLWDCALNGRTFMFDWHYADSDSFAEKSIALLKPQQDQAGLISENSLNPEEFARRGQESWHKGAGQTYRDRGDSDVERFRTSKGIDIWTKWRLSLLPSTSSKRTSSGTNLALAAAGSRLYVIDGSELRYTTSLSGTPTWTNVTGVPAAAPTSVTTDGTNIWTAHTASGIYSSTTSISTTSQYLTGTVTLVRYVKGRLMAASANSLWNVTAGGGGAIGTALYAHPNTGFTWVDFAEGQSVIYAAGYSGDKSLIYKTSVVADGTALSIPTVAGELPDGEIVRCIQGYLGYLIIGTDTGFRVATWDTNGNLTIGARVATSSAVSCFEPQDRFVWFGYTNYDSTSTGLGRMDLSIFNGSTPAYASDLMTTATGAVTSVVTFGTARVYAVSASGIYTEDTTKVSSGIIDGGLWTYALPDNKVAMYLDVRHTSLAGQIDVAMSANGGTFSTLGTNSSANSTSFVSGAGTATAETFEIRLTLTRSSTDTTTGPTISRVTLEANPAPGRGEFFVVPLLLWETVELANGSQVATDPSADKQALIDMETSGTPVTYQIANTTYSVLVDDHNFLHHAYTAARSGFNGTFIARLRRPRQRTTV